jgi:hypothetical protein
MRWLWDWMAVTSTAMTKVRWQPRRQRRAPYSGPLREIGAISEEGKSAA